MSDLEERLRAELGRRAESDAATVVVHDVHEVVERAARLRRQTRLGAAAGVVAAVLLVVLPVAVLTSRSPDDAPPQPAPVAPTPTEATDVAERVTAREWVAGLPTGPAPRIGYTAGLTLVSPDGSERRLGAFQEIAAFVPYRGGLVAMGGVGFEGSYSLMILDADLRLTDAGCTSLPPVLSADGSRVWWGTGRCDEGGDRSPATIHTATVDGSEAPIEQVSAVPLDSYLRVLGPLDESADAGAPVGYGVSQLSQDDARVLSTATGATPLPGLREGLDSSRSGLVAGSSGRAFVVVDTATGLTRWSADRVGGPASFSPDGRHVVVGDTLGATVFDTATGEVVATLDPPNRIPAGFRPFWEDDEHLLVGIGGSRGEAAVVRYDLAGDAELAVPWRAATDNSNPPSIGFEVLP